MGAGGVRLGRVAPSLFVRDLERAMRFWHDLFGMDKTFENGDVAAPENVMHMIVEGADELYRRCQAGGATIVKPLRDAPWGLRTFVVADPDGNRIDIGQRL